MALKLEEKKVVVAEVNAVAAKALSVVGAENRGLTVTQMTDLRAKARLLIQPTAEPKAQPWVRGATR